MFLNSQLCLMHIGKLNVNIVKLTVEHFVCSNIAKLHLMDNLTWFESRVVQSEVKQGYGVDMIQMEVPLAAFLSLLTDGICGNA